jgi:class 3 adenylate cyclase
LLKNRTRFGERRVITALFCDVVNSTGLAEKFDPEDWTDVMNRAYERLNTPILRYEGRWPS